MPMPVRTFSDFGADFGFMMSEAPGRISREGVLIGPTAVRLPAGTVLGQITATGIYVPLNLTATDGSQNAIAILGMSAKVKATNQRKAIGARQFEAAGALLFWPTGITAVQKKAAEAQLGLKTILVRN
jgi:hypothetical protein